MSRRQPRTEMDIEAELFNPEFQNDIIFSDICRDYIRVPMEQSYSFSNEVFEEIFQIVKGRLIRLMKINQDFERYFQKAMFGGSVGKGTKVGFPHDYDLNILIQLPINYVTNKIEPHNYNDSFITIDAESDSSRRDQIFCERLMDGSYLDQNNFRNWIFRVCSRAVERYHERYDQDYIITTSQSDEDFKIHIESSYNDDSITARIVPCLVFPKTVLRGFRNPIEYEWLAIALPLPEYVEDSNILWRPSFYEDEKEILGGEIKPFIRMLKKLRDSMGWTDLESYFIETLFMRELNNEVFESNYKWAPRTAIFIYMLKRLHEVLEAECLLHYWNKNINLFDSRNREDMLKISGELNELICDIQVDPETLLDNFSNDDDLSEFDEYFSSGLYDYYDDYSFRT